MATYLLPAPAFSVLLVSRSNFLCGPTSHLSYLLPFPPSSWSYLSSHHRGSTSHLSYLHSFSPSSWSYLSHRLLSPTSHVPHIPTFRTYLLPVLSSPSDVLPVLLASRSTWHLSLLSFLPSSRSKCPAFFLVRATSWS